jgi:predicted AlkP superfamily pyrophosphatase or phosphodiesterase
MLFDLVDNPSTGRSLGHHRGSVVLLALLVVAAAAASGCGARYIRSSAVSPAHPLPTDSVSRNVVIVSIDGLRPDAIAAYGAPTLQRLMQEGSYTLSARTIDPSKTLPSHTSMLTGQPPERHGVTWNTVMTAEAKRVDLPNIFSVARMNGYSTAAFFSKAKFHPLQLEGTLDYSQAPGGWFGRWSSERTVTDVATYLAGAHPNVLFVHLTDADAAGHSTGWMSPAYGRAVLEADRAVDRLISLADQAYGAGNFSLIVTADHGGHGTDHGSDDPLDVTIPWIAWGRGVKPGLLTSSSIRTMDTAATVLWLLNVAEPSDWAGQAVLAAYNNPAAR